MKVFYYIIFGIVLLSTLLTDFFGFPISYVYITAIGVILIYFLAGNRFFINRKKLQLFLLLTCLVTLDKLNDFASGLNLAQLFPIFYCMLIVVFLLGLKEYENNLVWSIIRRVSLIGVLLALAFSFTYGISLNQLNRDCSALLFIYFVSYFYSNKKGRFLVFLITFFLGVVVMEARTLTLSFGIFLIGYYIFHSRNQKKVVNMTIILAVFCSLIVTAAGIIYEYSNLGLGDTVFSGHGLVWGANLNTLVSASTSNILLGCPTTEESLLKSFEARDMNFLLEGKHEFITTILQGGNTHNGIVYTLYNTGIIGFILLIIIFTKSFKVLEYNYNNLNAFIGVFIIWVFNGRSLTGIYLLSTLMLITLMIPIKPGSVTTK